MKYPQIIFWKWDRETLENGTYIEKIKDLTDRSIYTHVYLALTWAGHPITDDLCRDAVQRAAMELQARGRNLMFDLDVRAAREEYLRRHPDVTQSILQTEELEVHCGEWISRRFFESSSGDHYGTYPVLDCKLVTVLFYRVDSQGSYDPRSVRIAEEEEIRVTEQGPDYIEVAVRPSPFDEVTHALVCVAFRFAYPDIFSPEFTRFHASLFEQYSNVPLDGVCMDEWGFCPYPGFSFSRAWKHPWYSENLARAYEVQTGEAFFQHCLHIRRGPSDNPGIQVRSTNAYYDLIRKRNAEIETWFYEQGKQVFGVGTFIGVHTTWHMISDIYNAPEIWKNGLYWFEAPRDFAQTDEIPVRPLPLAMARKWGAPWYNMWYSMGDLDSRTYLREIWENARYGGRCHALGYECSAEADQVHELAKPGELEKVSRAEERIRMLNHLEASLPVSDVLVVMGYYAAVNWRTNIIGDGHWDLRQGPFVEAFQVARDLWNRGYLCDLITSTEIGNGTLRFENGAPVYGGNRYKALIFIRPQFCREETLRFLETCVQMEFPLYSVGRATQIWHGGSCVSRFRAVDEWCHCRETVPPIEVLETFLEEAGCRKNPVENGCILADGTLVVTSPEFRPEGTPLIIHAELSGHRIEAEAEDLFALRLTEEGQVAALVAGNLKVLRIDGNTVTANDPPRDELRV